MKKNSYSFFMTFTFFMSFMSFFWVPDFRLGPLTQLR